MRVLLANKFLFAKGGAERAVLDLGAGLEQRGHNVFWFGMDHPENSVPADRTAVVRQRDYRRGGLKRYSDAIAMMYSWEARQRLANFLGRVQPDILHVHNIYHQLTPSILDAARQAGLPVVMTLHDYKLVCPRYDMLRHGQLCDLCVEEGPTACLRNGCAGSWAGSLLLTCEAALHRSRQSYAGVARFLTPSHFLRGVMQRGGWDATRLQHVGNFLPAFAMQGAERAPESSKRYLYAGRLSAEKGIGTLLAAVARVGRGTLVVCGSGPQEDAVRQAAARLPAGRIEYKGHVTQDVLTSEMQRADFMVLPSEWFENAPFAILEAMAAALPVLASRIGGIPELIDDAQTGVLIAPGNVGAWAQAIEQALDNPAHMRDMGARACRAATERFGFEQHLETVLALYEEVLQ